MSAPAERAAPADALWDAEDVALFLKCARKTVYNMADAGRLPCIRIGGLLRFDPEKIRAVARGEEPAAARVLPFPR